MSAVTRLGSYGGPRGLYGNFGEKFEVHGVLNYPWVWDIYEQSRNLCLIVFSLFLI